MQSLFFFSVKLYVVFCGHCYELPIREIGHLVQFPGFKSSEIKAVEGKLRNRLISCFLSERPFIQQVLLITLTIAQVFFHVAAIMRNSRTVKLRFPHMIVLGTWSGWGVTLPQCCTFTCFS